MWGERKEEEPSPLSLSYQLVYSSESKSFLNSISSFLSSV